MPNKRETQNEATNNTLAGAVGSQSVVALKRAMSLVDVDFGLRDNEQRQHEYGHTNFPNNNVG